MPASLSPAPIRTNRSFRSSPNCKSPWPATPYRQAPGQDLEGSNIFRISLTRLDQLEALAPDDYRDVLAFGRGQCLERLGRWEEAIAQFDVAAGCQTTLSPTAAQYAQQARSLWALAARGGFSTSLEGYLNDLDVLRRELDERLEQGEWTWPHDALAHRELERAQEETVALLLNNRMVLEDATARVAQAAQQLAKDHTESWRAAQHGLTLGTVYETLAHDWTARFRPEEVGFPEEQNQWEVWVNLARQAYQGVARRDGDPGQTRSPSPPARPGRLCPAHAEPGPLEFECKMRNRDL